MTFFGNWTIGASVMNAMKETVAFHCKVLNRFNTLSWVWMVQGLLFPKLKRDAISFFWMPRR